jgi:hypothetical protein
LEIPFAILEILGWKKLGTQRHFWYAVILDLTLTKERLLKYCILGEMELKAQSPTYLLNEY